ncbi:MAG: hydroxymethylbilane synthase [Candidatus Kapaibacteriales bacterium]
MPRSKFIVGTRGSRLALVQTQIVINELTKHLSNVSFEIEVIKTTGDKFLNANPLEFSTKGAFTKEIEEALLSRRIDFAVHSLKDLPTELPAQLMISAYVKRTQPEDVLISKGNLKFDELPEGSRIGTSSLRRKIQLQRLRKDIEISQLRGNIDTRLGKLERGEYDAIVVARAGLERLGLEEKITEIFPSDKILPAVGQGTIGIECHCENFEVIEITSKINHKETEIASAAERSFLRRLGGGCRNPIACFATVDGDKLHIEGMISTIDGEIILRQRITYANTSPDSAGEKLAEILIENGAKDFLTLL